MSHTLYIYNFHYYHYYYFFENTITTITIATRTAATANTIAIMGDQRGEMTFPTDFARILLKLSVQK